MTHTKAVKSAPFDSRSSLALTYLDEYPDIHLVQPDPVDEETDPSDRKINGGQLPPMPVNTRRQS